MLHPRAVPLTPPLLSRREGLLLAVPLAVVATLQALLTARASDMNVDGGYYLDVAMHVRDGHGLVSDVSLYHAGFPHFPHLTPIYPLWPWLLGTVGRVVEITAAAHWLPAFFWLAAVLLAWAFGRRLVQGPLLGVRDLNGGHLLALLLATQGELSRFCTWPYTEGLAYTLLFGLLWRLCGMSGRLRDGLELGVWLALICLCRSQLFVAPMAIFPVLGLLALLGGPRGRRWLPAGALALGVVLTALGVWWAHSRTFVPDASLFTLLRFDQAQVNHVLDPITVMAPTDGPLDFLVDRLQGVAVAYGADGWGRSYARGFFLLQWTLPLAALLVLTRLRGLSWDRLRTWLAGPQALPWLVLGLLALGGLASVHLPHKEGFGTWYFHRRHAIIALLAFFPCLLVMVQHPWRRVRQAAALLLVLQGGFWVESLPGRFEDARSEAEADRRDAVLAAWLQARASAEAPLIVVINAVKPTELAWRTDHVGYHWFYERSQPRDVERMFDELGAELLIFKDRSTRDWDLLADADRFRAAWVEQEAAPQGYRVFRRSSAVGAQGAGG